MFGSNLFTNGCLMLIWFVPAAAETFIEFGVLAAGERWPANDQPPLELQN